MALAIVDRGAITYANSTTPKSTASLTWSAGDLVLAIGNTEGSATLTTPTFGGGTFTAIGSALATGSRCWGYAWQCTPGQRWVGCDLLTKPATSQWWGLRAWIWRDHGGLGNVGRAQSAGATV